MKTVNFERTNDYGIVIRARFVMPPMELKKIPLVIMLTGDGPKGSNSLSWVNLSPRLADNGIATLLFDFTGLGNSDGDRKGLTLTKGISDFILIFNSLKQFEWIDFDNIGIMASSFGGSVALHCYEILNTVKAIGMKSPCCFLPDAYANEISPEQLDEWLRTGFCEENQYNSEVLLDPFKYNIYGNIDKITTKCLITHGDADEIVPLSQSKYLNKLLQCPHEFVIFKDCDHGYSVGDCWNRMADIFIGYFTKELQDNRNE